MVIKETLRQYFNEKCFGILGAGRYSLIFSGFAALNFVSASTISVSLGVVMAALATGQINEWQKQATGKPFWEPKISKSFGL